MQNQLIEIVRGDDKVWILTVTRKDTGAVVDITDCDIVFTVRDAPNGTVLFQKTSDPASGIVLTTPLSGEAEITVDATDTDSLTNEEHKYFFDVEITKTTGKVETVTKGKLTVYPDITYT